jgi:hypothetical protein
VIVPHQLPGLGPGICETHAVDNIVQPSFQEDQKVGASNALLSLRFMEIKAELAFQQAVHPLYFLFFSQLDTVVGKLLSTLTVLAWRIATSLISALVRITAVAFQK